MRPRNSSASGKTLGFLLPANGSDHEEKRELRTYHLLGGHTDGLNRKLSSAHVEEVFQVRSQKVDDENIMESLLTEVVYLRDSS